MKKLLITGLIAMGAMVFAPAKAHAQTIATFDVPFSKDINNNPVQGASGTYHTVITKSGATYTVTVTGNNDGNPPTSTIAGTPHTGSLIPKSGIGLLSFNFFDGNGSTIQVTALTGNTSAYSGPAGGNLGGPDNVAFGTLGGPSNFSPALSDTLVFSAFGNRDLYVAPHGGNTFTGTFTLSNAAINQISASYQDSGQQWTFTQQLVPEPATAAMALPGLLPMAPLALMALRRRRKATSDVEADEAEA